MMDLQVLGARMKSARKLRRKTLDDVALAIGLNKSTIQRYEVGKIQSPKLPVIKAIAEYLNVNPDWLTGEAENMEPVDLRDELDQYLHMLETRPELRTLLKSMNNARPADVKAVIDFFAVLRGYEE